MNRRMRFFAILFLAFASLFSLQPLHGDEPQVILDDEWKLWFRIGPVVGFPLGQGAAPQSKVTFSYGLLVGGVWGKIPGNWGVEFYKTDATAVRFSDIGVGKQAVYRGDDLQLLLSYQLPLGQNTGVAPFLEIIFGGILYTANSEAQMVMGQQWETIGFIEDQRFTYVFGAGFGASYLIGTVGGNEQDRPVGVAIQFSGRWLYGGLVPTVLPVSQDYPTLDLRHFQNLSLALGLSFLL